MFIYYLTLRTYLSLRPLVNPVHGVLIDISPVNMTISSPSLNLSKTITVTQ